MEERKKENTARYSTDLETAHGVPTDSVQRKGLHGHQLSGPVVSHWDNAERRWANLVTSSFPATISLFSSVQKFSIIPRCLMGELFTSVLYGQQNVTPAVCNGLLSPMSLKREWEGTVEKTVLLQSLAVSSLVGLSFWGGLDDWAGDRADFLQYSPSLPLSLVYA